MSTFISIVTAGMQVSIQQITNGCMTLQAPVPKSCIEDSLINQF